MTSTETQYTRIKNSFSASRFEKRLTRTTSLEAIDWGELGIKLESTVRDSIKLASDNHTAPAQNDVTSNINDTIHVVPGLMPAVLRISRRSLAIQNELEAAGFSPVDRPKICDSVDEEHGNGSTTPFDSRGNGLTSLVLEHYLAVASNPPNDGTEPVSQAESQFNSFLHNVEIFRRIPHLMRLDQVRTSHPSDVFTASVAASVLTQYSILTSDLRYLSASLTIAQSLTVQIKTMSVRSVSLAMPNYWLSTKLFLLDAVQSCAASLIRLQSTSS